MRQERDGSGAFAGIARNETRRHRLNCRRARAIQRRGTRWRNAALIGKLMEASLTPKAEAK